MAKNKETIYGVCWEEPDNLNEKTIAKFEKERKEYVLYQLYGSHHMYGRDVLLYIGRTENIRLRLKQHERCWTRYEYDTVRFRVAYVKKFNTWEELDKEKYLINSEVVKKIEALLIRAHQPAYNNMNKSSASNSKGVRIFNTGRCGQLFPEVSFEYFEGV